MKKKGVVLLLFGLIVIVSGWWVIQSGSLARPEEGVLDVWATWAEDPGQLQALFDHYSQSSAVPVRVTTRVGSDDLLEALASPSPPDVVILSSGDLVESYHRQGLVEPLDPWITATGIDLDDIYAAPLAQCQGLDGTHLCLPWGGDVYALFWNKDLFRAAGLDPERPPQTMEELAEYAARLTARDEEGELAQVGFVPDLGRSHAGLYARMFGGSWTNDDGTGLTVNSQPVIDAVNWQLGFYQQAGIEDVERFAQSLNRYLDSAHPRYAGRRLSCQQCHRTPPRKSDRLPDHGFYAGQVAMMVDGQWQVGPDYITRFRPELNYGVAPLPPPAGYPEQAGITVVQGAVVLIPAGAADKGAAAKLLAWMMSPEIVAEEAYITNGLPTSRRAAQDPRFVQVSHLQVFLDLMAHPNASHAVTTPISLELNEALRRVEGEVLHQGSDPLPLLNEVQAEFAPELEKTLAEHNNF